MYLLKEIKEEKETLSWWEHPLTWMGMGHYLVVQKQLSFHDSHVRFSSHLSPHGLHIYFPFLCPWTHTTCTSHRLINERPINDSGPNIKLLE
jgi:hypothetical protein